MTCGTSLVRADRGPDIKLLQAVAGHASTTMTLEVCGA
jgi:hypothetical protein